MVKDDLLRVLKVVHCRGREEVVLINHSHTFEIRVHFGLQVRLESKACRLIGWGMGAQLIVKAA
jgi:hypothetical protein